MADETVSAYWIYHIVTDKFVYKTIAILILISDANQNVPLHVQTP